MSPYDNAIAVEFIRSLDDRQCDVADENLACVRYARRSRDGRGWSQKAFAVFLLQSLHFFFGDVHQKFAIHHRFRMIQRARMLRSVDWNKNFMHSLSRPSTGQCDRKQEKHVNAHVGRLRTN